MKIRLARGESVHALVGELPWAYERAYDRVFTSMADGDRMRDYLAAMQIREWPYDRRPPKALKRSLFGGRKDERGRRQDDDGDYDDYDRRRGRREDD